MKLDSDEFKRVVKAASPFVAQKSPMTVLTHLLLEAANGTLYVSGSSIDATAKLTVNGEGDDVFSVTVPAALFASDVALIKEDEIELKFDAKKKKLVLKTERHTARFDTLDGDEFPKLQMPQGTQFFDAGESLLRDLTMVAVCASGDDKYGNTLTGVNVTYADGQLILLAADGVRASRCVRKLLCNSEPFSVTIPAKVIANIGKAIDSTLHVQIAVTPAAVFFQTPYSIFSTQLLDGNFPDIGRIMNSARDGYHTVEIATDPLNDAVRRALMFSKFFKDMVVFEFEEEELTVHGESHDNGSGETVIGIETVFEDRVAINGNIVRELVGAIDAPSVFMAFNGEKNPVYLSIPERDGFEYVTMPMRLS